MVLSGVQSEPTFQDRRARFWATIAIVAAWVAVAWALSAPAIRHGRSQWAPGIAIPTHLLVIHPVSIIAIFYVPLSLAVTLGVLSLVLLVEPVVRSNVALGSRRSWLGWSSYLLLLPWLPWLHDTLRMADRKYLIGYCVYCSACTVAFIAVDVHKRLIRRYRTDRRRGFEVGRAGKGE